MFNKCDKTDEELIINNKYDANVCISAKYNKNTDKLITAISEVAPGRKQRVRAIIPYSEGSLVNELHEHEKVISEEYSENGTVMELMVDAVMYERIKEYIDV